MKPIRVLFVIKKRASYNNSGKPISYGLVNSCSFLVNGFKGSKIESKVVEVIDNNCIDKEVAGYKPTHVILEALWVAPEKFRVLLPLHPMVKWVVRIHSNTPFLATEGVAFGWIKEYSKISKEYDNFQIAANSKKLQRELLCGLGVDCIYLPNIYCPHNIKGKAVIKDKRNVDVGCFGALRTFKNHLVQALAAMAFGDAIHRSVNFHINSSRFENQGDGILKNLRAIFKDSNHKLIEHEWSNHNDFIELVKSMDLGVQVSFTETYNIVAADFVWNNIPIVGSSEIEWLSELYQAHPTDFCDVVDKLRFAWYAKSLEVHILNKIKLIKFNKESAGQWKRYLKS